MMQSLIHYASTHLGIFVISLIHFIFVMIAQLQIKATKLR